MSRLKKFCFLKFLLLEERFVIVGHISVCYADIEVVICMCFVSWVLRREGETDEVLGVQNLDNQILCYLGSG